MSLWKRFFGDDTIDAQPEEPQKEPEGKWHPLYKVRVYAKNNVKFEFEFESHVEAKELRDKIEKHTDYWLELPRKMIVQAEEVWAVRIIEIEKGRFEEKKNGKRR